MNEIRACLAWMVRSIAMDSCQLHVQIYPCMDFKHNLLMQYEQLYERGDEVKSLDLVTGASGKIASGLAHDLPLLMTMHRIRLHMALNRYSFACLLDESGFN